MQFFSCYSSSNHTIVDQMETAVTVPLKNSNILENSNTYYKQI